RQREGRQGGERGRPDDHLVRRRRFQAATAPCSCTAAKAHSGRSGPHLRRMRDAPASGRDYVQGAEGVTGLYRRNVVIMGDLGRSSGLLRVVLTLVLAAGVMSVLALRSSPAFA